MMKNSGVSLITLVISVILLIILAGVSVNISYSTINSVRDDNLKSELGMVRQAVTEQYMKAVAVNQTGISADEGIIAYWVGTRINDFSEIALPNQNYIKSGNEFYSKADNYMPVNQEDFYYRLNPKELYTIGVGDSDDTYIVNYSTGEVYNETRQ